MTAYQARDVEGTLIPGCCARVVQVVLGAGADPALFGHEGTVIDRDGGQLLVSFRVGEVWIDSTMVHLVPSNLEKVVEDLRSIVRAVLARGTR